MIRLDKILDILILLIALAGVLPLYPYLETLPRLLLPLSALIGLIMRLKGATTPSMLLTLISIGLFLFYSLHFDRNTLVEPAANLLASLMAIRLSGERSGRALLQTCGLSIFCLAASTLFSLSPLFLTCLVTLSLLVVTALLLLTFLESSPNISLSVTELRSLGRVILATALATLPLMLLFFIIIPRTQSPLWNLFGGRSGQSSGLSDRVQPGNISTVPEDRGIAFRATMPPIDPQQLYWRTVVFNSYSSNAWVRRKTPSIESGVTGNGRVVQQTIFLEPGKLNYLPALNVPLQFRGIRSSTSGDLVTTLHSRNSMRNRYEAISIPDTVIRKSRPIDRIYYLKHPENLPPRLRNAAREIERRGETDRDRLELAKTLFHSLNLRYATSNLPTGDYALDRFLFDARRGHCEFFASSLAILLRSSGVPSRVVGGYYGGLYNELGGYYVVTDDMAHVWTEVFLEEKGWVTVDPSRWAAGFTEIDTQRIRSLSRRISTLTDTITYYWNLTVISYDLSSQLQLANRTGEMIRWLPQSVSNWRFAGSAIFCAGVASLLYIILLRKRVSVEERLVRRFIRLNGSTSATISGTGLMDIALQSKDPNALRFAAIYCNALYHDRRLADNERRELSLLLRTMERVRRSTGQCGSFP